MSGRAPLDQRVEAQVPGLHRAFSAACWPGGGDGPSTALAKAVNAALLFTHRADGGVEVGEEALEVDDRRPAVDPVLDPARDVIWRVWQAAQVMPTIVLLPEPLTVKPTGRPGVGLAGLGR